MIFIEPSVQKEQNTYSRAHETLSKTDHMLGHKVSLSKLKKLDIISTIFSDHKSMRSEINYKEKKCKKQKKPSTCRINNMLLNNKWITEEMEIKNT